MKNAAPYIYLNTRDELLKINLSRVVYFEADGNYTQIVLANGLKTLVCIGLSKMETVLSSRLREHPGLFVRIGKRFIVNTAFIYRIHVLQQELVLSDQASFSYTVGISKEALRKLKDAMTASITAKPKEPEA